MANKNNHSTHSINSIHGGISPTLNQGEENSYLGAKAIDPDIKINGRIGGVISPTSYEKTISAVSGVNWFEPNDQDDNTYYYTNDGKFGYVDITGGTSEVTALSAASGNGLKYYNNYYYVATNEDIYRYGPMDGTPALEANWWTAKREKDESFSILLEDNEVRSIGSLQYGGGGGLDYIGYAQSIEETEDIDLRYIEVLLYRYFPDGDDFDIDVTIEGDNAGDPDGTAIATGTIHSSQISRDRSEPAYYSSCISDLGTTITLSANTKYWVVLRSNNGWRSTDEIRVIRGRTAVYANGSVKRRREDTGAWIDSLIDDEDMLLAFHIEKSTFGKLSGTEVKTIKNYNIPNHHIYKHKDGSLYFTNYDSEQGRICKIRTVSSIKVDNGRALSVGDFIKGETSEASATIISIEQEVNSPFWLDGQADYGFIDDISGVAEVGLVGISGQFTEGETLETISEGEITVLRNISVGLSVIGSDDMALSLPQGEKPSAISSYGTDIIIGTTGSNGAKLFFWDTFAGSFYREVALPYPTVSALINHNGDLFVFGGSDTLSFGRYIGGDTIEEIFHCDHAGLPLQGAIRSYHNRILFGSYQTYPEDSGCVWAWGSKATVPQRLHNIVTTPTQVSSLITKGTEGEMFISDDGIYEKGGEYKSIWRSQVFNFSQPFTVTQVTIPFSGDFGTAPNITEIKVKLHYDDERATDEHTVTLEENSRTFTIHPTQQGTTNFYIEILWEGNTFVAANLPIRIQYQILE